MPLSRGYIHVYKQAKICIKSDFKDIFWNLQQMGKVTRPFWWHQKFVHKGLSAPAPRLYTCGKKLKMCIKSEFKEIVLKLATNDQSGKSFLLTSKFWPQGFVCPCPGAIYMYKIIKKCVENQNSKRSFWNLQQMVKVIKPFCWDQNFDPKALSAPAPGS